MNDQFNSSQFQAEFQQNRKAAMTFGGIVYTGVVIAATTLFISFILLAFPNNAYLTRAIMVIAGLLVGGSMIAFPVALHNWAVSGNHRGAAIALYYGEMVIIALNTVVSFAALLFKFNGGTLPDWIAWYEPISIISIVYTLFAWGTIFLLDPYIKQRAKELDTQVKFNNKVAEKLDEYLDSVEGEDAVIRVAEDKIQARFLPDLNRRRHFGSAAREHETTSGLRAPLQPRPLSANRSCLECGKPSGDSPFCSDEHGLVYLERSMQQDQSRLDELKKVKQNGNRNF